MKLISRDITVSSDYNVTLPQIIKPIKKIIHKYGFTVNNEKTRIIRNGKRMMVTGVVVNVKPNVPKKERRNLRAKLHNLIVSDGELSTLEYSQLRGQVEWVNHLNPLHGKNLLTQLKQIRRVIA